MPTVEVYGHFAVITSITEAMRLRSTKGMHCHGWRYLALMEIDPTLKPPSRIDPRIKSIKQIISISETFGYYNHAGFHAYVRERKRLIDMAAKFDKMWPLHIMAKEWPLPFPVYAE